MVDLIIDLIEKFITSGSDVINMMGLGFLNIVLNMEKAVFPVANSPIDLDKLNNTIFTISASLILFKFVSKLFFQYVACTEGDANAPISQGVINLGKALIVAVSFTIFYQLIVNTANDICNKLLLSINANDNIFEFLKSFVVNMLTRGLFQAVMYLIFFICSIIVLINFIMMGIEMFILKCFVPFACIGLLDSDKGMFAPVIKQIFSITITAIVQIILFRLSIHLCYQRYELFALAFIVVAMKMPKTLQFLLFNAGYAGEMVSKTTTMISQGSQAFRNIKAMLGK